jgi:eukaryotic-like serine/threonine-protein kinase
MILEPCPSVEELRRLVEERLGPVREAEIEAHVEDCPLCQDRLEQLTARRPWEDRDTQEATGANDGIAGPSPTAVYDGTTEPEGARAGPDATASLAPGGGAPETPRDRPPAPVRSGWPAIAGYAIKEKIGEGGMGVVYLAHQIGLNRSVAIKMIRGGEQARPEHFARFRIEAEAVARLRHPQILQIYDIGEADGLPYVALELLEGGGLDARLNGTPRPGGEAVELMIALAEALQVAHDAGIVHRDLKPSNILFTRDGIPKVTDFGLAKRMESDSKQTESGAILGTPSYMAPEQARGHIRDVGPAADIYAMGAILYELLTGRPPFKGETPIETIRQVVETEAVPPSRLVPKVARDLETVCLKCLSKEPARRYASARALAEDLARFRDGETIHARRASALERGSKWARRRPAVAALWALGVAAFLGTTIGGALHLVGRSQRAVTRLVQGDRLWDAIRAAATTEDLTRVHGEISEFLGALKQEDRSLIPDLEARMTASLREVNAKLSEARDRQAHEERVRTERERFDRFVGLRAQAQLGAAEYELNPVEGHARFRDAVREALSAYARAGRWTDEDWALAGELPDSLTDAEKRTIVEGCYDLLLILSRAVEPAAGLKILDRAARLRPDDPTAAYHLRRATLLARLGDADGRAREEELAARRPPVTPLDHFLIGRERLTERRWDEAIDALEEAIRLDPSLTAAHLLLAVCHYQVQPRRLAEALGSVNTCLRAHRDLIGLYLLRALIHGEQGNHLMGMIREHPAEAPALREKAARSFDAALADYRAAMERRPNDELRYVLLVNRGGMYLQAGRAADSLADLEAAIRLNPRPYEAYATLGQLYQGQGRLDESSRAFAQAIERAPDPSKRAELHRTRARLRSGRRDATPEQRTAALRDLDEAIRLDPVDRSRMADDHVERARLLFAGGQPEAAVAACAEAMRRVPDHAGAHRLRISSLLALKRHDEVLGSCDAYLAREEPTVEVLEIRGLARVARENLPGAIADYTRAIELRPDTEPAIRARLLNHRGWAYHLADAPRLALSDFEASLKQIEDQAEAHAGRGLARVRLGDWEKAVADAEAAVRLASARATDESGPDARRQARLNAARIYTQAAEYAAAGVGRQGERAVRLYRGYRTRALDLLRQVLEETPAADRAAVLADPALRPLRLGRGTSAALPIGP